MRSRAGQAGFTLLEIAVALAVLGVGIVTCLQIFSGSLRLQSRSARQSQAVIYARAAMDDLLHQREQLHGTDTTIGGFHVASWLRRCGPEEGCDEEHLGTEIDPEDYPVYLQVDVTWQDGVGTKTYTLKTLRLAPPE
jgi:prepilin-type N-terminal cleavage/methylation domain-containing protein